MNRSTWLLALVSTIGWGATRLYDVEIHEADNCWTQQGAQGYAQQVVVNTADSLLWCDVMIGDLGTSGGQLNVEVQNPQTGDPIYSGAEDMPDVGWRYVRVALSHDPAYPMVSEGKELTVKVTRKV